MTAEERQEELVRFRNWLYEGEKARATTAKYVRSVRRFLEWLGGAEPVRARLLEYREELNRRKTAQSVNGDLAALNAWLGWKGRREASVRYLKVQRRAFLDGERRLDRDDYRALLSAAERRGKGRLYMIMLTLAGTGIRISELPFLTVEAVQERRTEIRNKGKSREILLGRKLRRRLAAYAQEQGITGGVIFRTKSGKPVDRSNIFHELKSLARDAHVSGSRVFPHNFRHLFARAFYQVSHNLANLADVLGHSSIETTRRYVADSSERLEDILAGMALDPEDGSAGAAGPQCSGTAVQCAESSARGGGCAERGAKGGAQKSSLAARSLKTGAQNSSPAARSRETGAQKSSPAARSGKTGVRSTETAADSVQAAGAQTAGAADKGRPETPRRAGRKGKNNREKMPRSGREKEIPRNHPSVVFDLHRESLLVIRLSLY